MDIIIVGTGGAGNNTVNYMLDQGIEGRYVAVYTIPKLHRTDPNYTEVAIGAKTTKGIGAGGNPEIGRRAAEENIQSIRDAIRGADMVFVTCGMGGGTGTGSAPVIAKAAREMGILTVGVVTKPFRFEGTERTRNAESGIGQFRKETDALIVIPNDKILELVSRRVNIADALRVSDSVLVQAITGIADIVRRNGLVNLDFADVRTILKDKGLAHLGIGTASGEDRAIQAMETAIHSKLLETDVRKAKNLMVYFTGDISLGDVQQAGEYLTNLVGKNTNVILGMRHDEEKADTCTITLIAT